MELQDVDIALEELEIRLERLRALYEQYFLGIEKIEPTVVRKDVDRRLWALRRAQIRNTAKRFKLQTIVQRYNTFQQYWGRICREIENGTYKRHLARAEKRFGSEPMTIAAKRRFARRRGRDEEDAQERAADAARRTGDDLAAMLDDASLDPVEEAKRAVEAAMAGPAKPPAAVHDAATDRSGSAPRQRAEQPRGPLDLDLSFDEDSPAQSAAHPPGPRPGPARSEAQSPADSRPRAAIPRPARPRTPPPAPSSATRQRASPERSGQRPPPVPRRPAGTAPQPRPASGGQTAASPARPPSRGGASSKAGGWALLDQRKAAQPKAAAPPGQAASGLSQQRINQLHAELVATKKKLNQQSNVSVDGLAKTLRATEVKLQQKTKGRRVDFQVVVKDGQAVVKPVVRK